MKANSSTAGQHKITSFLWFDNQAEEAVKYYTSIFKNSRINTTTRYGKAGSKASGREAGSVMTIAFQLEGLDFVALNGGPVFEINPTISFFVNCRSHEEIDSLWTKLGESGKIFMELDKYQFSERYGWMQDKFGVSWQLILADREQKITPCLMFTGEQHKKAEEAINYYISVFKNSSVIQLERYAAGIGPEGAIVHCKFSLNGYEFTAMDSHQQMPLAFNPAISMVVNCNTQGEIDNYWEELSRGGDERAQQCGWLQDKFGMSWQIVPAAWGEMLRNSNPGKSEKLMEAILKMKKIDLEALKRVY